MSWRKHKCVTCGYLCVKEVESRFLGESYPFGRGERGMGQYEYMTEYVEITPKQREDISGLKGDLNSVFCYRHEVTFETELKNAVEAHDLSKIVEVLKNSRDCSYHIGHVSGYTPQQHLMRWESIERERSNRRWSLLYIVIGALITVVGGLLIKLIWG